MSTVQEIESAIDRLPREELLQLVEWLKVRFEEAWDRQIEEDVKAGKFDDLAREALSESLLNRR
ncbi:MAG TPA: hypothetical protein VGP72_23650 [Planctomycetota bacterium]|jgi:hypothetical protein